MPDKCQGLEGPHRPGANLKQHEEQLRLLVEQVKDYAIFLLDEDGCVVSWNPGAEAFKGYRADEILGKSFELFYLEEDRLTGKPLRLLTEARTHGRVEDEGWRVRKDGRPFWADVVITALVDASGTFYGYAKITRDLTERRDAEERLRLANAELERRVYDRTTKLGEKIAELEAFNEATVGRELRMIELKRENEALRREMAELRRDRRR